MQHDPGGKKSLKLQPGVVSDALFHDDMRRRLFLSRAWGRDATTPIRQCRYVLWIGMNPSTADAEFDDLTVRKEIEFTKRLGYFSLVKTNLMDYRATYPYMLRSVEHPCSDKNLRTIADFAEDAALVVGAWGSLHSRFHPYIDQVEKLLKPAGVKIMCLGITRNGSPRHPSRISYSSKLERW